MGLFWDKLKAMFKKKNRPYIDELATEITFVTKKITVLPQPNLYDPQLSYRKSKSQRRNWSKWKNR